MKFLSILFVVSVLSVHCFANITVTTVPVGDPGNAGELSGGGAGGNGPNRICGAVDYSYKIGKYEITVGQYCNFLNSVAATDTYGLYNQSMWDNEYGCKIQRSGPWGSCTYSAAYDWINRPVNFVSFWDAVRFANWLHNGQPRGPQNASTTGDGAYFINGYNGYDGRTIQRKSNWGWAVTSEDEWYKAAYYKGGGIDSGYWDYAMQSDISTTPSNQLTNPDPGNNANFYQSGYTIGSPYYRTNVGQFKNSESAYGTFDQCGNVAEWNEAIPYISGINATRGVRGGAWNGSDFGMVVAFRNYLDPNTESSPTGFRVVQAVPEPSSLMILAGGIGMILGMRRRRA